jgi:signal peptidase II
LTEKARKITWFCAVAAIVVVLDQWSKTVVRTSPDLHQLTLIEGWLAFNFTTNPGMAMGIAWAPTWVISLVAIAATIGITWYAMSIIRYASPGFMICMGLIIGGALGNIADRLYMGYVGGYGRVLEGHVVDFIHFKYVWPEWFPVWGGSPSFPYIFNVADIAISVSIISMLVFAKWLLPAEPPKVKPDETAADEQNKGAEEDQRSPENEDNTDSGPDDVTPAKTDKEEPRSPQNDR